MAHLKPRSATIVLYQGDDMDRLAQLKRDVDIAERVAQIGNSTARVGDVNQSVDAARDAFDAFVDDAASRALSVELRTIGRRRFRDLLAEHPPRMVPKKIHLPTEGETAAVPELVEHEEDAETGVNTDTFGKALLAYRDGDIATIASPEFATKADVERFLDDEVSEGDFDGLWQAAYLLNRTGTQDPKVLAHWPTASRSTDET